MSLNTRLGRNTNTSISELVSIAFKTQTKNGWELSEESTLEHLYTPQNRDSRVKTNQSKNQTSEFLLPTSAPQQYDTAMTELLQGV